MITKIAFSLIITCWLIQTILADDLLGQHGFNRNNEGQIQFADERVFNKGPSKNASRLSDYLYNDVLRYGGDFSVNEAEEVFVDCRHNKIVVTIWVREAEEFDRDGMTVISKLLGLLLESDVRIAQLIIYDANKRIRTSNGFSKTMIEPPLLDTTLSISLPSKDKTKVPGTENETDATKPESKSPE